MRQIALSYLDTINKSLRTPRAEPNSVAVGTTSLELMLCFYHDKQSPP